MLPVANIHLKDLYDNTLGFFAQRSPSLSAFRTLDSDSEVGSASGRGAPQPRSNLRESISFDSDDTGRKRCHSTCSCPSCTSASSPPPSNTPDSMRKNANGRDYDSTKNELMRTQNDVVKLEERCRALERTLRETKEMLRVRDVEIDRLRREREREAHSRRNSHDQKRLEHVASEPHMGARRSHDSSSRRSHDSGRQSTMSGGQYMPSASHHGDSADSGEESEEDEEEEDSEEERAHLRGLDTFLTKVDRFSGAQIIQALQDLNSEILQFAASATDLCTFDKYSRASPARTTQATKETAARLGPSLARFLSSRDHAQDPILVQLALQACVATCISRALSTFCFGFASKPNAVLSQIYAQMYSAGESIHA